MAVPAEYRKALREKLMGKGSALAESISTVQEEAPAKAPFTYWKGEIKRNLSENNLKSPFKFSWGEKIGMEVTNLMEEEEVRPLKQEVPQTRIQRRIQNESKSVDNSKVPEGTVIPGTVL